MLSLKDYQELHETKAESFYDEMIRLVSVVHNIDPLDVEEWNSDKLISEFDKVKYATIISDKHNDVIVIDEVTLQLIPFSTLTLGQFIDLETLVADGYIANVHKIASAIYLSIRGGGMSEQRPEKYANININYRAERIQELPAQMVLGACNKYLDFRRKFFESYDLFKNPFADIDESLMDDEELAQFQEEKRIHENSGGNQWSDVINVLATNDITKFNKVLECNLFLAFNQISWLKSNEK